MPSKHIPGIMIAREGGRGSAGPIKNIPIDSNRSPAAQTFLMSNLSSYFPQIGPPAPANRAINASPNPEVAVVIPKFIS